MTITQHGRRTRLKPTFRRAATAMATIVVLTLIAGKAHAQFTLETAANLPPVSSGSAAWGDYDNDGRLDLLLTGADATAGQPSLSLWHNTGAGFSNVTVTVAPGLPGLYDSSVAWGDYDNDGRLDLLVSGLTNFTGDSAVSQIWRNTAAGFTNVPVPGLRGVGQSTATWSDYDGDGRLDFMITGTVNGSASGAIAELWRNTGSGFTQVPVSGLPGVYFGSVAWGDFDNDTRPDFLITGITNGFSNVAISQLWRNTGNGFTNVPVPGLAGVFVSSAGWADYDNDGFLDFLLQGISANGFITRLWRNTGNGFTNISIPGLPGVADGSLAWADYDSDGRMDFLITGLTNGISRISQIWRNSGSSFTNVPVTGLRGNFDNAVAWGDYDRDGRVDFLIAGTAQGGAVSELWHNDAFAANSPPVTPAGLSASVFATTVNLNWDAPGDDHTPAVGLTYNVRLGTAPGAGDVASAPALTNGMLLAPRTGSLRNKTIAFHQLTRGRTYYWSVQAVDSAFGGSPFGAEQQFSISTEVSIPDAGLNATIREALNKATGPLTEQDLLSLTNLDAGNRNITNVTGIEAARNLISLSFFNNHLTNFVLPIDFRNLAVLDLGFNKLDQCVLQDGMTNLNTLFLEGNALNNFTLPSGLIALSKLDLAGNALTSLTVPAEATNLTMLLLFANQLTNLVLPPNLNRLGNLDLNFNHLSHLALPAGMKDLTRLSLRSNAFTNLTLPPGMTNLTFIDLIANQLTSLTLPSDLTNLTSVLLDDNPLSTFVLPEPLAAGNLSNMVASLRDQGVSVFAYPLAAELVRPRTFTGRFQFGITGPPGVYVVLGSTDLATWSAIGTANNVLGSISFNDVATNLPPQKFYRVLQSPTTDMVFIPPNTFTMGSPTSELHRQTNEGPQTVVTLTRGFWIGKYEVTQVEYLSVMNTNPSAFPGDLSGPVSSVSWPDATNYCAKLTEREFAAGRIPFGSKYRLPTEAEWECAARAGTTNRFSYGDDPDYINLPNYAWQSLDDGLTVHRVGQKLPNPWGLYDMYGNVFEWCQDWLGPLPGGTVTDPQGPPSNPIGWKIMRGGAFDVGGSACRSASRSFFGNHPALTDWNLGFRVVLVIEP